MVKRVLFRPEKYQARGDGTNQLRKGELLAIMAHVNHLCASIWLINHFHFNFNGFLNHSKQAKLLNNNETLALGGLSYCYYYYFSKKNI